MVTPRRPTSFSRKSPIRDESGHVGGVLTTCTETTDPVMGERRLRPLRALAEAAAQITSETEAFAGAANLVASADTPFALFYALLQQIVQARGGRIEAHASEGSGTVMLVERPRSFA